MITLALQRIYSSNTRTQRVIETVVLEHSQFADPIYLVRDSDEHAGKLEDGSIHTFSAYGFDVVEPEAGSDQQDLEFSFDNVMRAGSFGLEKAAQKIEEPIRLTYRLYIKGEQDPQSSPLKLYLTGITANMKTITARASRTDLIARHFPFGKDIYFDQRFGGIL